MVVGGVSECHFGTGYCGMTIRLYEEMLAWTVQFGGCGVLTLASLAGPKWESLRFLAILLLILGPLLCLTTLFFHHEFDTFSYSVGDNHGLLYGFFILGLVARPFVPRPLLWATPIRRHHGIMSFSERTPSLVAGI